MESVIEVERKRSSVKTGYLSTRYAKSLQEFGHPRQLKASGGQVLERRVPGSSARDAMGCYPLFICDDWSKLIEDVRVIENERRVVCLYVVTDPFGEYDYNLLKESFQDVAFPFKKHFIADLCQPAETFVCSHHRRYARWARRRLVTEKLETPINFLEDWVSLYSNLTERHAITGVQKFSPDSFREQLQVPGLVALRAIHEKETVGIVLWYLQGEVAYYHLGAYSPTGYRLRASFAIFWEAIRYFRSAGVRWLSLGGGAGISKEGSDGLSRFKRGWSTGTRSTYFCGRIFDRDLYTELTEVTGKTNTEFFPAYRVGEFAHRNPS